MKHVKGSRRAGLSLVEAVISITILALVLAQISVLARASTAFSSTEMSGILLEEQGRHALGRITDALVGAERATLDPALEAPAFSSRLRFQRSVDFRNGAAVLGDTEAIALDPRTGTLRKFDDLGGAGERSYVWSRSVTALLEGELANGLDDNGNGLIDEPGLTFTVDGNLVNVLLTLEREVRGGQSITRTFTGTVRCRQFEP